MTRDIVTVTEEMLVKDVVHLLQERHLIRAPVLKGKALVGVVARRDILGYVRARPTTGHNTELIANGK